MGSSFKGVDVFGSGPQRWALGRQGHLIIADASFGSLEPGSQPYGLVELDVVVSGRLVAPDEASLWSVRDAVVGAFEESPTPGELIDLHGRSWGDMTFIRYEEQETVDRGRVVSIGYEATFRRFRDPLIVGGGSAPAPGGEPAGGAS